MTLNGTSSSDSARDLFLQNLPLIERIIRALCRRRGIPPDEVEDFASFVQVHLIEDDYAVLRRYDGRSSLSSYLSVLISRWLIDVQIGKYGKWHASAAAERLGPIAMELERLVRRDGQTLDAALPLLRAKDPTLTRERLETLAASLPARTPRARQVPLDEASAVADEPDGLHLDRVRLSKQTSRVVRKYLDRLNREDRLLLQFRFALNLPISVIAGMLMKDQKGLYRRQDALIRGLRKRLEAEGIHKDVLALLPSDDLPLDFGWSAGDRDGQPGNRSDVDDDAASDEDSPESRAPTRSQ